MKASVEIVTFQMIPGCLSTHGGMGYSIGDYWDGDAIVCGTCGYRIENPMPTGSDFVEYSGFWNSFIGHGHWVPHWPDFIRGKKGVSYE